MKAGHEIVGVREVNGCGAVVFPARKDQPVDGALLLLDASITSADDIRRTVHDLLSVADDVWLESPTDATLTRVKGADATAVLPPTVPPVPR